MLENLIRCGAFDSMGARRSQLLDAYEQLVDSPSPRTSGKTWPDSSTSSAAEGTPSETAPQLVLRDIPEFSRQERMTMEKETTGLYLTGHPMDEYRAAARACRAVPIGSITADFAREGGPERYADGQKVTIAGVVTASKTPDHPRSNSLMAYATLEDDTGALEVLIFLPGCWGSAAPACRRTPRWWPRGASRCGMKSPLSSCATACAPSRARPNGASAPAEPEAGKVRKLYLRLPAGRTPAGGTSCGFSSCSPGSEPLRAKFAAEGQWTPAYPCQIHPLLLEELRGLLGGGRMWWSQTGQPEPLTPLPGGEAFL